MIMFRHDRFGYVLVASSLALVAICAAWYAFGGAGARGGIPQGDRDLSDGGGRPYAAVTVPQPAVVNAYWPAPVRQSWSEDAIFGVFTPPIIYYNSYTGAFSLEPPAGFEEEKGAGAMELIGLERRRYRLQFEGYVGGEGEYTVLLENLETGEGLRGRPNDSFPEEGFTIRSFRVDRRTVQSPEQKRTPYVLEVVVLEIFDEREKALFVLGKEPAFYPGAEALLRWHGERPRTLQMPQGGSVELDGILYTLRSIDLANQMVTIEKRRGDDNDREIETLALSFGGPGGLGVRQSAQ